MKKEKESYKFALSSLLYRLSNSDHIPPVLHAGHKITQAQHLKRGAQPPSVCMAVTTQGSKRRASPLTVCTLLHSFIVSMHQ